MNGGGGTVDNRIVQMEFNNQRFESNVKQSLSTLDRLKKALNFKETSKDLEDFQRSADSLNLDHIANAVDAISNKFTLMGQIGMKVIDKIATKVVGLGEKMAKSIFVDQIGAGMNKYEAETNAVQTMYANVKKKGKSLDDVYATLEKLQSYADETSYSYSQMTNAMSRFINAGVDMEQAENAMEGIANLAAISGVGIHETEIIFRNFADAISKKKFQAKDWISIESTIGTENFMQEVIDTAKAVGRLDESGYILDDFGKRVSKEAVTLKNFKDMLSKGFFDEKVMMTVLGKYADRTGEVGKEAFAAAQNAKTFSDVLDAVKDAASTGWSKSFRLIFGDLNEAIALFTPMANKMIEVVNQFDDYRNNLLQGWRDLGGRDNLIAALSNIWDLFTDVKDWIGKAGSFVWGSNSNNPLINSNILANLSSKFKDATQSVKDWLHGVDPETGAGRMQKLFSIFRGAMSVVDLVRQAFGGVKTFFKNVLGQLMPGFDALLSFFMTLGNMVYRAVEKMKAAGTITRIANGLADALRPITSRIPVLIRWLQSLLLKFNKFTQTSQSWKKFTTSVKNGIFSFLGFLPKVTEGFFKLGKAIFESVKNSGAWAKVKEGFAKYIKPLGPKLSAVGKTIGEALKNFFNIDTSGAESMWEKVKMRFSAFSQLGPWLKSKWEDLKAKVPFFQKASTWFENTGLGEKLSGFGKKISDAFKNMFSLDTSGIDGLKNKIIARIKAFFSGIGSSLSGGWQSFKANHPIVSTASNWISKITGGISGVIEKLLSKKGGKGINVGKMLADKLKDMFSITKFRESFAGGEMNYSETVKKIVEPYTETIKEVSGTVTRVVRELTGGDGLEGNLGDGKKSVTVLDKLKQWFSTIKNALSGVFKSIDFSKIGAFIKNIDYKGIFEQIKSVAKDVLDLWLQFKKIKMIGNIGKGAKSISGFFDTVTEMLEGGGLKSLWTGKGKKSAGDKIKSVLIGIIGVFAAIFVAAVALKTLANMQWDDFLNGLLKVGLILTAIGAFTILTNKLSHRKGDGGDEQMAVTLGSMIGIVASLWLMGKVIKSLGSINPDDFWSGYTRAAFILGAVFLFITLTDGLSAKIKGAGEGSLSLGNLLGVVLVVWLMGKAIGSIGKIDESEFWTGYWMAAAILGVVAAFFILADGVSGRIKGANRGESALSVGALIGLALAVKLMGNVMMSLSKMNDSEFLNGFWKASAILGVIAVFFILAEGVAGKLRGESDTSLSTTSLLGIVAFIKAMQVLIKNLADTNDDEFWNGYIKFAAILVVTGLFILAFSVLVGEFRKMDATNFKTVLKKLAIMGAALAVVAGVMVIFALLANKIDGVDPLSMIAFAAAVLIMSAAVVIVAHAMNAITATKATKWSTILKKMAIVGASMIVILGIMTIFALLAHKVDGIDPLSMLAFAASVVILTFAVSIAAAALNGTTIGNIKWGGIAKKLAIMTIALLAVAGIMTVFALLLHKTKGISAKNMLAFAASVTLMTVALAAVAGVMSAVPVVNVGGSIAMLLVSALAMAGLMWVFSEMVQDVADIDPSAMVAFGAAIALISVAMVPLAAVCAVLGTIGVGVALQGAVGLVAVGAALGVVINIIAKIVGNSIAGFGARMDELGSALNIYDKMIADVDFDRIRASIELVKDLVDMAVYVTTKTFGSSLQSFTDSIVRLGAGLAIYSGLVKDVDMGQVMISVATIMMMATMFNAIPEIKDQSQAITNIGAALELYSGMTSGLTFGSSIPDTSDLIAMLKNLAEALPEADLMSSVSAFADDGAEGADETSDKLTQYALGLVKIAEAMKIFGDKTKDIDFNDISTAIGNLQQLSALGSTSEISRTFDIGGFISFSETINKESLATFADDVAELGQGLLIFSQKVGDESIDQDAVARGVTTLKKLAGIQDALPYTGGLIQMLTGEQDLAKFSTDLPLLGTGLKGFADNVKGLTFEGTEIESAISVLSKLVEESNNIPSTGGLKQLIEGVKDISGFGEDIGMLGFGIRNFIEGVHGYLGGNDYYAGKEIHDITDQILLATQILQGVAYAASLLPETGGLLSFFGGDESIESFGEDMDWLGYGLRSMLEAFYGNFGGYQYFDPDVVIQDGLMHMVDLLTIIMDVFRDADSILNKSKNIEGSKYENAFAALGSIIPKLVTAVNDGFASAGDLKFTDELTQQIQNLTTIIEAQETIFGLVDQIANIKRRTDQRLLDAFNYGLSTGGYGGDPGAALTAILGRDAYGAARWNGSTYEVSTSDWEAMKSEYFEKTIKESLGTMAEAVVGSITAVNDAYTSAGSPTLNEDILTQIGKIQELITAAGGLTTDSLPPTSGMQGIGQQLAETLATGFTTDSTEKLVQAGVDAAWAVINAVSSKSTDMRISGRNLGLNIASGIAAGSAGPGSLAILKGAAQTMGNAIIESFKETLGIHSPSWVMMNESKNIGKGSAAGIKASTKYAIEEAEEMGVEIVDAYGNSIEKRMKMVDWAKKNNFNFSSEYDGNVKDYWEDLTGAFNASKEAAEDASDAVKETGKAAEDAGDQTKKGGGNAASGVKALANAASSLVDYTADLTRIINVLQSMDDRMESIGNKMGEYFAFQMAGGIDQNGDPVVTAAENLASRMAEHMSHSFGDTDLFELMGLFAIIGLAHGISGNSLIATDAMGDLSEAVLNRMREALGIHSPSTETAEMGKNLVYGLKKGIEDNLSLKHEMAQKIAGVLSDTNTAFEEGFNYAKEFLNGADAAVEDHDTEEWISPLQRMREQQANDPNGHYGVKASIGMSDIVEAVSDNLPEEVTEYVTIEDGNVSVNKDKVSDLIPEGVSEYITIENGDVAINEDKITEKLDGMTEAVTQETEATKADTEATKELNETTKAYTPGPSAGAFDNIARTMTNAASQASEAATSIPIDVAKATAGNISLINSLGAAYRDNFRYTEDYGTIAEYLSDVAGLYPYIPETVAPVNDDTNNTTTTTGNGGGGSGGGGINGGKAAANAMAAAQIDYSADLRRIIDELQSINDRVEIMQDTVGNLQIVLDTGALVGSTAASFDETLGTRAGYAARGIAT